MNDFNINGTISGVLYPVYANEQQYFPTTNATPFTTTTIATDGFDGKRRNPLIRDRTATIRALVSPEFPALLGRFVPV